MLLLTCPNCGHRNSSEFRFGGEYNSRPKKPCYRHRFRMDPLPLSQAEQNGDANGMVVSRCRLRPLVLGRAKYQNQPGYKDLREMNNLRIVIVSNLRFGGGQWL